MPNSRDTGDNVKVDFVWGNIPMQPNDDRGEAVLDPELDNHIIVTTEYNGFPGYIPANPYLDTVENATVPNVVGLTESAATTALTNASLVKGAVTTTADGATSGNNNQIKTQTPAAGTKVNEGTSVALVRFAYVAPALHGPTGDWVAFVEVYPEGNPFELTHRQMTVTINDLAFNPMYGGSAAMGRSITIAGASSLNGTYTPNNGANSGGDMQFTVRVALSTLLGEVRGAAYSMGGAGTLTLN
jgi:hypothetical protein